LSKKAVAAIILFIIFLASTAAGLIFRML